MVGEHVPSPFPLSSLLCYFWDLRQRRKFREQILYKRNDNFSGH